MRWRSVSEYHKMRASFILRNIISTVLFIGSLYMVWNVVFVARKGVFVGDTPNLKLMANEDINGNQGRRHDLSSNNNPNVAEQEPNIVNIKDEHNVPTVEDGEGERESTISLEQLKLHLDFPKARETKMGSTEKRHLALLKVHKTGSSTVQNIFLRFGNSRNLTFILGHDNKSLSESGYTNVISYRTSLNERNIVAPPTGCEYEILCCHLVYNRTQFRKYLPTDTAYIGMVRDPIKRLESSIRYFNLFHKINLTTYASNPFAYDGFGSMSNNRMSFEFGFPRALFPKRERHHSEIKPEIETYLYNLYMDFDLILVNERMDESLVLMKRMLRWTLKDIIYLKQNQAPGNVRRFSEEDKKKLEDFLYLDFALYKFARDLLEGEILREKSKGFDDEVFQYKTILYDVDRFCNDKQSTEDNLKVFDKVNNHRFEVSKTDCGLYTLFEMTFIQNIRKRMYGRVGI